MHSSHFLAEPILDTNYLNLIDRKVAEHTGQPLTNLQRLILEECCQTTKTTYGEIASKHNYAGSYIQQRVAPALWNLLTKIVGQKITKANCRGVLLRYVEQLPEALADNFEGSAEESSAHVQPINTKPVASLSENSLVLDLPTDSVPLGSPLYIQREPLESRCYEAILQAGALIRIKAPRQMGKTSLTHRIVAHAPAYQSATLNFQQIDRAFLSDLNRFMRCVCATLARQLKLPPNLDDYWDDDIGSKMSCTQYLEEYILEEIETPLILVLEEAGELFEYEAVAQEFFTMLRAWHEYTKHDEIWQKLRLVLVQSTEMYLPLNLNQSPFNVGLEVALSPFDRQQVRSLAERSGVTLTAEICNSLMALLAGHPYLVSLAFYHIAQGGKDWDNLLTQASTDEGIFKEHLHRHLWMLQQHPELSAALQQVLNQPDAVNLPQKQAFKLNSLGLVALEGNQVRVSCELYQRYFSDRL